MSDSIKYDTLLTANLFFFLLYHYYYNIGLLVDLPFSQGTLVKEVH